MTDKAIRLNRLLRLLPAKAPGRTSSELQERLREQCDMVVDLRTIQRDLNELSGSFPITSEGAKPARWFWSDTATAFTLPSLDSEAAATWTLVEQHLSHVLPRSLLDDLKPRFEEARGILERYQQNGYKRWTQRVRSIPRTLPLIPPAVPEGVTAAVYNAVLTSRQLRLSYRRAGDSSSRDYTVHPLAIVHREGVIYLVATIGDYENPVQFAFHRMLRAEMLDAPSREQSDFDLDVYIAQGEFAFATGKKINLDIRLSEDVGFYFTETRLAVDQVVRQEADGRYRLKARVDDSFLLLSWLRSLGRDVEVVSPKSLARQLQSD